jgi:hypothetical protein
MSQTHQYEIPLTYQQVKRGKSKYSGKNLTPKHQSRKLQKIPENAKASRDYLYKSYSTKGPK